MNYAWAGATTGSVVNAAFDVPDLRQQVQAFLESHAPSSDQLFVIYVGFNDLSIGQPNGAVPATIVTEQLSTLAESGARDSLVLNLETINTTGSLKSRFETYNRVLADNLESIRLSQPDVSIIEFDTDHLFKQIESNASEFGFTELNRGACRDCSFGEVSNPTQIVENVAEHLFWDRGHVTARAHEIVGDAVFNRLLRSDGDTLGADDIDLLLLGIRAGLNDVSMEVNEDWLLNDLDRIHWVHVLKNTWIGDANLDGEFNSGDLIVALAAGTYELDVDASWESGDFDGSGRFDTADPIVALADGGYEKGPRAATAGVPEPSTLAALMTGLIAAASVSITRRTPI